MPTVRSASDTRITIAYPQFEAICYPTATAALEALKNGEVDCMFPANLTDYDGEQAGIVMTPALMCTEMDAVVREADRKDFLRRVQTRVGVNKGNPNYEMFLVEHFPSWTPVTYDDTPTCLKAVAEKNIDCVIVSNYRYSDIAWQCDKLNLTTVYTGVDMDYSLAVREGNTTLYSILSTFEAEDVIVRAAAEPGDDRARRGLHRAGGGCSGAADPHGRKKAEKKSGENDSPD